MQARPRLRGKLPTSENSMSGSYADEKKAQASSQRSELAHLPARFDGSSGVHGDASALQ